LTQVMPAVGMLAAAAGLAYWVACAAPVRQRLTPWFERLRVASRLPASAVRIAAFLLLVILLGVRLIPDLDLLRATLTISQRLYGAPTHSVGDAGQASIREALRTQDTAELELHYVQLLVNELITIFALVAAYYVTREWRYQLLMVAPFALVFLSHTIFLPMS